MTTKDFYIIEYFFFGKRRKVFIRTDLRLWNFVWLFKILKNISDLDSDPMVNRIIIGIQKTSGIDLIFVKYYLKTVSVVFLCHIVYLVENSTALRTMYFIYYLCTFNLLAAKFPDLPLILIQHDIPTVIYADSNNIEAKPNYILEFSK